MKQHLWVLFVHLSCVAATSCVAMTTSCVVMTSYVTMFQTAVSFYTTAVTTNTAGSWNERWNREHMGREVG